MIELFILILLMIVFNSFYVLGFYFASEEGNILSFIRNWTVGMPDYITRPLYGCPKCMASVHSVLIYWMVFEISQQSVLIYPAYICALSFMNNLLMTIYEHIE